MLTTAVNITIILILLLFLYIGYSAGIIKSFFAVSAGFFSALLAERYPYQEGINYYFVFVATAVIIFITGIIVLKIVKFLYLSLFDKIAGAFLGALLGFIISVNFVIPTIDRTVGIISDIRVKAEYVSDVSSKALPMFGKYVPKFLYGINLKNVSKDIKEGMATVKNFGKISKELENKMQDISKDISKEKTKI